MKKTVLAKLVYNAVLTFVVHAFLFIYVPALTQRFVILYFGLLLFEIQPRSTWFWPIILLLSALNTTNNIIFPILMIAIGKIFGNDSYFRTNVLNEKPIKASTNW